MRKLSYHNYLHSPPSLSPFWNNSVYETLGGSEPCRHPHGDLGSRGTQRTGRRVFLWRSQLQGSGWSSPDVKGDIFVEACPGTFCQQGEESVSRGSRDEDRKGQYHGGGGSSR